MSRDEGRSEMSLPGYHSPRSLYLLETLSKVLPNGVHRDESNGSRTRNLLFLVLEVDNSVAFEARESPKA
jgi:hypothetical protein